MLLQIGPQTTPNRRKKNVLPPILHDSGGSIITFQLSSQFRANKSHKKEPKGL
jgi:hypothetical protein